jgi:hypothetical protein
VHAAITWYVESVHAAMLASFMLNMPRQCRIHASPVEMQWAVASSRVLYFAGCMDSAVAALAGVTKA